MKKKKRDDGGNLVTYIRVFICIVISDFPFPVREMYD